MKFKINLASQPYEDVRRFYWQWGAVLAGVVLLTVALVSLAGYRWQKARALHRQIAQEQQLLNKLNEQEAADLAILNKAENHDVHERSVALNNLIRRKEFSWTRIFAEMEKLMPTRLHVVSIVPQLTQENEIELHLNVAGDSHEKAVELAQHMEKSADFRHVQILSETNADNKQAGGDAVQFEITALYIPGQLPPPEAGAPASPAAPPAKAAPTGGAR